jgi:hypothetical protein
VKHCSVLQVCSTGNIITFFRFRKQRTTVPWTKHSSNQNYSEVVGLSRIFRSDSQLDTESGGHKKYKMGTSRNSTIPRELFRHNPTSAICRTVGLCKNENLKDTKLHTSQWRKKHNISHGVFRILPLNCSYGFPQSLQGKTGILKQATTSSFYILYNPSVMKNPVIWSYIHQATDFK